MGDLRHALKQAMRNPGLSIVVILMLAVGIGATTAVYSVFHDILVRALPVPEPEPLVNLGAPGLKPGSTNCTTAGDCTEVFSYPMFRDLEARQTVLTGIGAHREFDANLAYDGNTLAAAGLLVSGGYFPTLGLTPAHGRLIAPQDESRIDESAVVVLSHDYWQSAFGGDENVVGRTVTVNGQALTIVGIAPQGFAGTTFGVSPKVFVPVTLRRLMEPTVPRDSTENRRAYWLYLFGRLAPGVSMEQASVELNGIYSSILNEVEAPLQVDLSAADVAQFRARQITVEPGAHGQSWVPSSSAPVLIILLGATVVVLLIVCANIANLLLAHGASRAGEMAIRASLGAIVAMAPANNTPESWGLANEAMLFGAVVTLCTVLVFGLVPAWRASRADPGAAAKGQAAQATGTRSFARFRGALSTAQIAFSTALLVLAGLFAQSLINVSRSDLGLNIDSVVTFTVSPRLNGHTPERVMTLYDEIEEQIRAQPGVTAVGSSSLPLLANNVRNAVIDIEGFERGYPATQAGMSNVGSGFFAALSVPLLAGRDFTAADRLGAPRVAIVNESFVRKFNLGEQAIGARFAHDGPSRDIEIVGVVRDAKYAQVRAAVPAQFFLSRLQNDNLGSMTFYARAGADPRTLMSAIRETVGRIDPNLPLANLMTMQRQVHDNMFLDRFVTWLSTTLAVLAAFLAGVGLYGVLAFGVANRTRELGLRLALGAAPGRLRWMLLRQVGIMALVGGGIGLAAAIGLGRAIEALLVGVSGYDPVVLVSAVALLALVIFGASYVPARRASRLAPMAALRHD